MSVPTAVSQLLSLLEEDAPASSDANPAPEALNPSTTLAISLSRVGDPSQKFVSGTLEELSKLDEDAFGGPLHSFVIVGNRFHALERDFAARWAVDRKTWDSVSNGVYGVRD